MPGKRLFGDPFSLPDAGPIFTPAEIEAESIEAAIALTSRSDAEHAQRHEQARRVERLRMRDFASLAPIPRRGPVDLERFPFQFEPLYSDAAAEDREQVSMKCTQAGFSEGMIRQALFHADVRQRVVIYTFPTLTELRKFSAQRIAPTLRASEHLSSRMSADAINNMEQRQVGLGWVYFFGTDRPIDSVDADVVIFDEYDTSDQANINASESRVTGPLSAGLIRRLGVPSAPGFGIARFYERSDQRVWTVRCGWCEEWNPMRGLEAWEHNIDRAAAAVVCRHCRRTLDVRVGEWVAKYPDRAVKGYHAPKMIVFGQNIARLIVNSEKKLPEEKQDFVTRDLGEPYAEASGRLSLDAIRACMRDDLHMLEGRAPTAQTRTMGVDQASARALNVVIEEAVTQETTRVLWAGEVDDEPGGRTAFGMLCFLMDAFSVHMAGIDNGPDGRFAKAFVERFSGRAYRVGYYHPRPSQRDPADYHADDGERFVAVHRTRAIDAVLERFRLQRVWIPHLDEMPAGDTPYAEQLGNLQRRVEQKPDGREDVFYVNAGPTDWAHAHVYCYVARLMALRQQGLNRLLGQGLTSLTQTEPFQRSNLSDPEETDYRPGFERGGSPFGSFFDDDGGIE